MKKVKDFVRKAGRKVGRKATVVAGMAGMMALQVGSAYAAGSQGGGDTTFDTIMTTVSDWSKGSLGKTLAIGSLLVGGGYAVVSQSLRSAVTAVALALTLAYGPGVLEGIFTATF